MASDPPTKEATDDGQPGLPSTSAPLDLTLLLAVHHGLRRDLQRFLDHVDRTPVDERVRWEALCTRWDLFATLVHHCFQWELLHLWPLIAAAAQDGSRPDVEATLAAARTRAEHVEAMIESSRPVFGRLALAHDEDAVATLRVRVRAACDALEECLDSEEDEVVPLMRRHIASRAWSEGQHRLFEVTSPEARGHSRPWLVHELPFDTAAVVAAGWGARSGAEVTEDSAAFRDLETRAFGAASTSRPGV